MTTNDSAPTTTRPLPAFSAGRQLSLSAFWFASNLQWLALLQIIMPHQIEQIAGKNKALWLGSIDAMGAIVAVVAPPIVGALSDRCLSRWGRRRPYLATGSIINIAGLLCMLLAANAKSAWFYLGAYLLVQLGNNIATAAYSGIIPDLVPAEQRGEASGYMGAATQLGSVIGAFGAGFLATDHMTGFYLSMCLSFALFTAVAFKAAHEEPLKVALPPMRVIDIFKAFWVDPRKYPDFGWVWITRFLFTFGLWLVQPFLLYYLRDVIHVQNPAMSAGILMGIALLCATVTGFLGGSVSDRLGRKPVVIASTILMAVAGIGFLFTRSFGATLIVACFYGLSMGAYVSVDWALGCDVLPNKENAAKDMGVWHISMVLPQSLAPLISGIILHSSGSSDSVIDGQHVVSYSVQGYSMLFILAAAITLLSGFLVRNVRGVR
jgi:MFS family permease